MDGNALYEAIFKRKSIRDYDPTPIDTNRLEEISTNLQSLKPLLSGIKTEFKIISPNQVTRKLGNKAPHFIAAFSEAKDIYKVNIGFMLQQMDLHFSAIGLGSCWLGIPQPSKDITDSSNLEFIILMSFGNPKETLHRTSASEFKRKSLNEITNIQGANELLEPARLAPSAVNLQNWYFTGDMNAIHAYSFKPNFLRNIVGGSYYPVNMGITLCHLQLAAEYKAWKTKFVLDSSEDKKPPKNLEYVASLKIEKSS
ncbi:MAG TPA: nitroreductase family protein [Candidatus Nanoarchaeia archaeon]|nr:nitroreductase family protein [Candidatus Nanoarchaeia archaeon]